jgi:hypothetical protein
MSPIDCLRTRARFELYLDGDLPAEDAAALEAHLFACAACAAAVGEDVRLGEAFETAMAEGPLTVGPARAPGWRRARAAAAAAVLLAVGAVCGRFVAPAGGGAPGLAPSDEAGRRLAAGDLVPLTEVVDEPWVGLASFTDQDLIEAERDALLHKVGEFEERARRVENELDFMRPMVDETATPERVIARLKDRVRAAAAAPASRPSREDVGRMREVWRHGRVAAMLLSRDPHAAFGPVSGWLASASTPLERRTAVKLLAALRLPAAHDLLVAETQASATRELALDGLLALRDPRSREFFARLMDDPSLDLDPTRLKAAGGLHRLGDPRGLDFLVRTFRAHPGPGDLRRRILFHVGANPSAPARAILPELLDGVRLDGRDRGAMAEFLALSGVSENDPVLLRLMQPLEREPRPHERRSESRDPRRP